MEFTLNLIQILLLQFHQKFHLMQENNKLSN